MAYSQSTWYDRDSEHPNRRTLTNVNDPSDVKTYDISRAEGVINTLGTPITAQNMNDLETRIASAFTEVNNNMPEANPSGAATGELEKLKVGNTIYSVEGAKPETATIQNTPIASFSDGADNVPVSELIVNITATQAGSGTPSPLNVRSISGWSSVNLVNMSDITNKAYFEGLLNGTYGFVDLGTLTFGSSTNNRFIASVDNLYSSPDNNTLPRAIMSSSKYVPKTGNTYVDENYSFYIQTNGALVIRDVDYSDANTFQASLSGVYLVYEFATPTTPTITTIQFNALLKVFDIDGFDVRISLGDTYYGGTLNVTTGELTVTHELVNLKILNWGKATNTDNTYFYVLYSSGANGSYNTPATNILCSTYNSVSRNNLTNTAGTIGVDVEPNAIYIADSQYDSYTTTQFAEAMENVQLVVPLATPTTVQLTPTEVRTLLDDNNIFADTGDINKLVYFKTGCEAIARLIEAYGIETEVAGTLTAGQTSITLTNNAITTNSTIDVYTDADVDYNSISVSTGSVTITFDAQASNLNVKVRIS